MKMEDASSPLMEPEIWEKLPAEILDHVLSFLPLKTFFNLRSTCKHFNSLFFSPSFISNHLSHYKTDQANSPPPTPFSSFLLLSYPQFDNHFPLYDTVLSHWRTLALSLPLPSTLGSAHLVSSSNGLLCFSLPAASSFFIFNILTRSSRLVDFPIYPFHFRSVTLVAPSSMGYKLFVLSSGYLSKSAFVFDSKSNSWSQSSVPDALLIENSTREGVFHQGCLYFTSPEPFSIVGFNVEEEKWEDPIQELPEELTFARLVSDGVGGKLFLVGGVGSHGISRSMKLWELRKEDGQWVESQSLPPLMCRKFMSLCYHNYEHVYCLYNEGMICVCCYTWPGVLYYKISRQTWHWLPKCPSLPEKWSCGFRWFSFVPNIFAQV